MEKENGLEIGKILTFFISALLINYVIGNFYDAFVVRRYSVSFGAYIGLDETMSKNFALLFFGAYVFAYSFITTWFLQNVFSVGKKFLMIHMNTVLGFLVAVGILWTKGFDMANPSFFISYLPIVSLGIMFFGQILSEDSIFGGTPRVRDAQSFMNSIKEDVRGANAGVADLLSGLKESVTSKSTEGNIEKAEPSFPFAKNAGFGGEGRGGNPFSSDWSNENDKSSVGEDSDEGYIDLGDEPVATKPAKKELGDEFFNPKDLKGILKGNRERTSSVSDEDAEPDTTVPKRIELDEPLQRTSDIRGSENDAPAETDGVGAPDDYISVMEFDEDDSDEETPYGEENPIRVEKNDDAGISDNTADSREDRGADDGIRNEDFYAVGFVTNSEIALLSDLMKKL